MFFFLIFKGVVQCATGFDQERVAIAKGLGAREQPWRIIGCSELMAYFNSADLTPAELEDLAFLRARRSGINEDVEVHRLRFFFSHRFYLTF